MDIFFHDPNDIPLPPNELEIRSLEAAPYSDGRRVAVRFEITPFQKRPNLEIEIRNPEGRLVADLSVVETIENRMDFTLHLREEETGGVYTVVMKVFYTDLDNFELGDRENMEIQDVLAEVGNTVAQAQCVFEI